MKLLLIVITYSLLSNVVLSQFLGLCPFLGVSKKVETAAGMGGAVIFVICIASVITGLIYKLLLVPMGLEYLQTIAFIVIIAALVQFIEMFLKKYVPSLYAALGIYLPLITTNCAVLGVALNNVSYGYLDGSVLQSIGYSLFYGLGISVGFFIAIVLMAGVRERIAKNNIPKALQGSPIVLIAAGLMAIAFCGFSSFSLL